MPPRSKALPDAPAVPVYYTTHGNGISNGTPKKARAPSTKSKLIAYYLIAYNVISTLGWAYVLFATMFHLATYVPPASNQSTLSNKLFSYIKTRSPPATIPNQFLAYLAPLIKGSKLTYFTYHIGHVTAAVQTLAILEIVHSTVKWVRSPVNTAVMQVSSRLFLVWVVAFWNESAQTSPFYSSMVWAWALTEVIRYPFYAASLVDYSNPLLTYLRYTTFWALYPIGAGSEMLVTIATFPLNKLPSYAPAVIFRWILNNWTLLDYFKGLILLVYIPGFYTMYTHMIKQRAKVLGTSEKSKTQ